MIAAICFRPNQKITAKIYVMGTSDQIDWKSEYTCELGEQCTLFNFYGSPVQKPSIMVERSINGEFILRLVETRRYVLKIECDSGEDIILPRFQNENNKFLKCDKDSDRILFQFVNYLGRSKIIFEDSECTHNLVFEVVPDKMSYEEDYIVLTEALANICSELLLDYAGATSNVYHQSIDGAQTLFEQFVFLRQFCYSENLTSLFEAIKRNPDHQFNHEEMLQPYGTGRPSQKFYSDPFGYSRGWRKIKKSYSSLGGYVPGEIAVTRKYDNLDTPANRFIKFALEQFDGICSNLIQLLGSDKNAQQTECLNEAKAIHGMLEDIFGDSFWDTIGSLDIMPQNNQVLQKREGYSQILLAYSMVDLALQLDWRGQEEIYEGESKNVALLYEYWLFFELYKIIKEIVGCEAKESKEDSFLVDTGNGITVSLEQGKKSCQSFEIKRLNAKINLYYNRTFSQTEFCTTMYEGSYSRPFRPDYTIAIFPGTFGEGKYNGEEEAIRKGAVSYIHFDAKYRISDLTSLIGNSGEVIGNEELLEEKSGSVINTYKRGDLLKMHTYNDAIRRTVGSYVLYPGSDDNIHKRNGTFRLYDEILPGIGAFAIRPGNNGQAESELREFVTMLIEAKERQASRLNRMRYYAEMVIKEPSLSDLSHNKLKGEVQKELCVLGYIRAGSRDDYYYFLKRNNLLKIGAEFLFYFYAIKGGDVYSHHKDIFKAVDFRFYINQIDETGTYRLEPVLCKIKSNELISKKELVERLAEQGYEREESKYHADFYYVLTVEVVDDNCSIEEIEMTEINSKNGNDTFSPHSPKVIVY